MDIEKSVEKILKLGVDVRGVFSLDGLLQLLADRAKEIIDVDRCSIFIHNQESDELWTKVAHGVESLTISIHKGIVGEVFRTKEPKIVNDVSQDSNFLADIDSQTGYSTRSLLSVPLTTIDGKTIGVFQAINKNSDNFTQNDANFLMLLGSYTSFAIENAILHEELMHAKNIASVDHLTGIFNRVKFDELLEMHVNLSKRYSRDLTLCIFDIDDFKLVNDKFGHIVGDTVIKMIASIASQELRETDIIARWGGEEFVLLFPETNLTNSIDAIERIRTRVESYEFDEKFFVTCSFGVSDFSKNKSALLLLQNADDKLYEAKYYGKNRIKY